jgi:2'-5' RNA ligase
MEKRHRIFIAINLPEDIKKELAKIESKYLEIPCKWTARDNLHITLEFLGDLTAQEIGDTCITVKETVKFHKPFSIDLKKILYGPNDYLKEKNKIPKMIWAEGGDCQELFDLKNDLQNRLLEKVRFKPEQRKFLPHITLARISTWEFRKMDPEEIPDVSEDVDLVFSVESIEVMESELKKGGPRYTILDSQELSG